MRFGAPRRIQRDAASLEEVWAHGEVAVDLAGCVLNEHLGPCAMAHRASRVTAHKPASRRDRIDHIGTDPARGLDQALETMVHPALMRVSTATRLATPPKEAPPGSRLSFVERRTGPSSNSPTSGG